MWAGSTFRMFWECSIGFLTFLTLVVLYSSVIKTWGNLSTFLHTKVLSSVSDLVYLLKLGDVTKASHSLTFIGFLSCQFTCVCKGLHNKEYFHHIPHIHKSVSSGSFFMHSWRTGLTFLAFSFLLLPHELSFVLWNKTDHGRHPHCHCMWRFSLGCWFSSPKYLESDGFFCVV